MKCNFILSNFIIICGIQSFWLSPVQSQNGTQENSIFGNWYCPSSDLIHRFSFSREGVFGWHSFQPDRHFYKWSENMAPVFFRIVGPRRVVIAESTADVQINGPTLTMKWDNMKWSCTRERPALDTEENALSAKAQEIEDIRFYIGLWRGPNRQFVQFLPDWRCNISNGRLPSQDQRWTIFREGSAVRCGDIGIFTKVGADTLEYEIGSSYSEFFRRAKR